MQERKPQQSFLTNLPVDVEFFAATKAAAARWDANREQAVARARHFGVYTLRYQEWEFSYLDGYEGRLAASGLLGRGTPQNEPFSEQAIEDIAAWVDDADWLDVYHLEPHFPSSRIDSLLQLIGDVGDIRPSDPLGGTFPPGHVFVVDLLVQLRTLRNAFLLGQAIQRLDFGGLYTRLVELARHRPWIEPGSEADLLLHAREWALGNALVSGLIVVPKHPEGGPPYETLLPPATPIQVMMLAFATSIGAIDSNTPAPYVCEHHTCGKVFVTDKHQVRGIHRFCSPRCGKRFSSIKSTNAQRTAARAAKEAGHGKETPER